MHTDELVDENGESESVNEMSHACDFDWNVDVDDPAANVQRT